MVLIDEALRHLNHPVALRAGAQEDGEQLGARQRLRPEAFETFTRALVCGELADA